MHIKMFRQLKKQHISLLIEVLYCVNELFNFLRPKILLGLESLQEEN